MGKTAGKAPNKSTLVSFKIATSLYVELEKYAGSQQDESGADLSPSQAARRLVIEALKRLKK